MFGCCFFHPATQILIITRLTLSYSEVRTPLDITRECIRTHCVQITDIHTLSRSRDVKHNMLPYDERHTPFLELILACKLI